MARGRLLVIVLVAIVGVVAWSQWPTRADAANPLDKAKIKLYSGGQVVGEWESFNSRPQIEGKTLVFQVRKGTRDVEVRIQGTYSYEVIP